jgi:hypothetical protein
MANLIDVAAINGLKGDWFRGAIHQMFLLTARSFLYSCRAFDGCYHLAGD